MVYLDRHGGDPPRRHLILRLWLVHGRLPDSLLLLGSSNWSDIDFLLINLGGLSAETAGLTGTLFMGALLHAVETTAPVSPTFLYLDEFQKFNRQAADRPGGHAG